MKKALIVTRVSGFVPQFEMKNVKILQSMGYEVHYAANFQTIVYGKDNSRLEGTGIVCHPINMVRSPFSLQNWRAYWELCTLMKQEKFDLVHCHMPVGSVIGRLAAYTTGTAPVIYTAHGFHFYKGAPLKNWIPYYLIERLFAFITDAIITINQEDYKRAKTFCFRKKQGKRKQQVFYIPGIGISVPRQTEGFQKQKLRQHFQLPEDHFIMVSVGELSERKNHVLALEALAQLKELPITYVICGSGVKEIALKERCRELGIEKKVIMMGYVEEIQGILGAADCFVFPSRQEGLPVAVMEAMEAGLPVVATDIRGNRDLIVPQKGGYLLPLKVENPAGLFSRAIRSLYQDNGKKEKMGAFNQKRVQYFSARVVEKRMKKIYKSIAGSREL